MIYVNEAFLKVLLQLCGDLNSADVVLDFQFVSKPECLILMKQIYAHVSKALRSTNTHFAPAVLNLALPIPRRDIHYH